MKKSRLAIFAIFFLGMFMLTSCGITTENFKNSNQWSTEVKLNSDNYRIVKQIKGEAQATYVFGIGGMSKRALTESAISNMLDNAQLTGSQAIINTTYYVNTKNVLPPIYIKRTAYATAYVIEFTD